MIFRNSIFTFIYVTSVFAVEISSNDAPATPVRVYDGEYIKPLVDPITKKYLKQLDQSWILEAQSGLWGIVFLHMSIEHSVKCQHDSLQLQEISNSSHQLELPSVKFCGDVIPRPYISVRSRVLLRFFSDNIWENEGFKVQVIHSDNKEELLNRLRNYNGDTVTASQKQLSVNGKDSEISGKTFYVLVGTAIAVTVLFVALLSYFIKASRRQHNARIRVPDLYYISGGVGIQEHPNMPPNHVPNSSGLQKNAGNMGKQTRTFKRDVDPTQTASNVETNTKEDTLLKSAGPSKTISHHNNLYVSEYKPKK